MANRKRPALKVGDVCMFSKNCIKRRNWGNRHKNTRMVVLSVDGDGSSRFSRIRCLMHRPNSKVLTYRFDRRELWFTGYNIGEKSSKSHGNSSTRSNTPSRKECVCEHWMTLGCTCGAIVPYKIKM